MAGFLARRRGSGHLGAGQGRAVERAGDGGNEVALLAQDQAPALGEGEILPRLRVGPKPGAVGLVGGEAGAGDQAPGDVVRALVRQEVADQVPAGARDEPAPVGGVGLELGALAAAFLKTALRRQWFVQDLDSRILAVTARGRGELAERCGLQW